MLLFMRILSGFESMFASFLDCALSSAPIVGLLPDLHGYITGTKETSDKVLATFTSFLRSQEHFCTTQEF